MTEEIEHALWLVERRHEVVLHAADRFTIATSGALILENGDILGAELVIAYAAGEWETVTPYRECECEDHE